ncbi:MAG TPA: glycosyltransferase [Cyclobacteriaceae bacterium]|jgi:glycosyltransferase involved in cell wall biosynthesis|nr:glycosyltransferase [Cyclobacteriaceae bacterium]
MDKINYITNLSLTEVSGGWSGINHRMHEQFGRFYALNTISAINPPIIKFEKIVSKFKRILGMGGEFFFFSDSRLEIISRLVEQKVDSQSKFDFYFGLTPWVKIIDNRPYALYLDASFRTYIQLYLDSELFSESDVKRICKLESAWLDSAKWVFWGSNWAMREAIDQYGFVPDSRKHLVINTGGNIPIPESDVQNDNDDQLFLLFISLNFEKKGGFICWDAFKLIQKIFPQARLKIIGERPPAQVLDTDGVDYLGRLNKNKPEELRLLTNALASASFLIHPTKMDTMGAVILEAGYYGCPSIAPNKFGIPDLIKDGETGFLLEKVEPQEISDIVTKQFSDRPQYKKIRQSCRAFTCNEFSWSAIGEKMNSFIVQNG